MESIPNKFKEHRKHRTAWLGEHISIKTTKKHYTRVAKDFK